jgi:hypothetical protein
VSSGTTFTGYVWIKTQEECFQVPKTRKIFLVLPGRIYSDGINRQKIVVIQAKLKGSGSINSKRCRRCPTFPRKITHIEV